MNDIDALKNFLLDATLLEKLENSFSNKPNIFSILKVENREIRHSNLLAWLLNPKENHNLGNAFLSKFIETFVKINIKENKDDKLLLINYDNIQVKREWKNIDLLLLDEEERIVFVIENKINTKEHDNQLERYFNTTEEFFNGYDIYYIFLTLDGREPEQLKGIWNPMGYENILYILEEILSKNSLNDDVNFIINNYKETVRSLIEMENPQVKELCMQIYDKHKKAIDLIIENIPSRENVFLTDLSNWIKNEWSNKLIFKNINNHKWFEFFTTSMNELLPNLNGKSPYKYFISVEGNCCKLALELQYEGLVNTPNYGFVKKMFSEIYNEDLDKKGRGDDNKWIRIVFKTWRIDISNIDDDTYENYRDKLKKEFENILFMEIPSLEKSIREINN